MKCIIIIIIYKIKKCRQNKHLIKITSLDVKSKFKMFAFMKNVIILIDFAAKNVLINFIDTNFLIKMI